jgi:hypothetical protein
MTWEWWCEGDDSGEDGRGLGDGYGVCEMGWGGGWGGVVGVGRHAVTSMNSQVPLIRHLPFN